MLFAAREAATDGLGTRQVQYRPRMNAASWNLCNRNEVMPSRGLDLRSGKLCDYLSNNISERGLAKSRGVDSVASSCKPL